jgi:3-deoxy-7-phosphoheptulonate synthase
MGICAVVFCFSQSPPKRRELFKLIIVMEAQATSAQIGRSVPGLKKGVSGTPFPGSRRTIIGAIGQRTHLFGLFETLPGVEKVVPIAQPFKMASREFKQGRTQVQAGEQTVGGGQVQIIAGPCAVEGRSKFLEVAQAVKEAGATMLRGGAFKPRTSPYSFQGLEQEGLEILAELVKLPACPW